MRYRKVGRTGLVVSELCLGSNMFGGGDDPNWKMLGGLDQKAVNAVVARATEGGVNIIDTADVYTSGQSEQMVGQALKDLNLSRSSMVLCTKSGMKTGPGLNDGGASRAYIQRACERSLKRMGTDYIDLYLVHVFDPATPLEETLRALDDLVRAGKVRYVGCSNFFAWEAAKANGIAERLGLARFDVMESNWSIATREIERELVPMAVSESIGVLAWGALLGGMLTGKYKRGGAGEKLGRLGTGAVSPLLDENKVHDIVDVLREVAEAHGATPADIALAFVLHNKAATSVIFGATRPDQVDANLRASEITLTPEEMQKLDAVSALKPDYAVAMMAGARDARKRLL